MAGSDSDLAIGCQLCGLGRTPCPLWTVASLACELGVMATAPISSGGRDGG